MPTRRFLRPRQTRVEFQLTGFGDTVTWSGPDGGSCVGTAISTMPLTGNGPSNGAIIYGIFDVVLPEIDNPTALVGHVQMSSSGAAVNRRVDFLGTADPPASLVLQNGPLVFTYPLAVFASIFSSPRIENNLVFVEYAYNGAGASATSISDIYIDLSWAPTVTSVDRARGGKLGGDIVAVFGSGFVAPASVSFGGIPATNVAVLDSRTLVCTTPAHAIGVVDVAVTIEGDVGTGLSLYEYLSFATPPTIDVGPNLVARAPLPSVVSPVATVTPGINNGSLTYAWTQISGPQTAGISGGATLTPSFTFAAHTPGTYTFRLTVTTQASDGIDAMANSQDLTVTMEESRLPVVSYGTTRI